MDYDARASAPSFYAYVKDDPTDRVDPSGLEDASAVLYGAGAGPAPGYYFTPEGEEAAADTSEHAAEVMDTAAGAFMPLDGAGGVFEEGAAILRADAATARADAAALKATAKAEGIAANAAKGKAGEAMTRAKLGDKIAGEQVTFKTNDGTRTRADFVTSDKGVVETKTGNGDLRPGQEKLHNDIKAGRTVTPVGANAAKAGLQPGQPTTMSTCQVDRPC